MSDSNLKKQINSLRNTLFDKSKNDKNAVDTNVIKKDDKLILLILIAK